GYDGRTVIEDVNLTVRRGELVALVGANGAGKSTLLKVIVGLLRPYEGSVSVLGSAPGASARRLAYLPQAETVHWDYPLRVEDVVLMGRVAHAAPGRGPSSLDRDAARTALGRVQADDLARRPIQALSGGQRQRILLARPLASEPLQYAFVQRALLAAVLVALVCASVGVFVVLRGLAFLGDAIAHAAFPGVVIAFLVKINIVIGGSIAAVASALAIGAVARRSGLKEDTAIGVVFSGMFAIGIVLFSSIRTYTGDLLGILFGDVLGVSADQLTVAAVTAAVVLVALWIIWRQFVFVR